jgi:hypothetical protein
MLPGDPEVPLLGLRRHSMLATLEARPAQVAIERAVAELTQRFGNRVVTSRAVREQHANTTTWVAGEPPDAVFFPQSAEDVQQAVRICALHRVPVIPYGTGTSFEGHVNAPFGGVSIDLKDMNRVLAVHSEDFDCVSSPALHASSSTTICATKGCSFRSIPVRTPPSGAWPRRAPPARPPSATAR